MSLFFQCCSFLSLADKRLELPRVSRQLSLLLALPLCYAHDTVRFALPDRCFRVLDPSDKVLADLAGLEVEEMLR